VLRVVGTDKALGFAQVVEAALADSGTLTVKGVWSTPKENQGGTFRGAAWLDGGFSYAAQVVEVSVDEDTGVFEVEHVWVAHDCGFAINPLAVEGQVQGAVWMAWAGAVRGDAVPRRPAMRPNFLDYRIPTSPNRRRSRSSSSRAWTRSALRRQGSERRRAARLSAGADNAICDAIASG